MRTRGEPGDIQCDRAARHAQQTPDPCRHGLARNSSPSTEDRTDAPAGSLCCAQRHTGIQDPAGVKPSPQSPHLASGDYNVLESHTLPNPSPGIRFGRQPQRLKARTLQALGRNALDPASHLRLPVCPERASCGSWSTRGDGVCGHRAGPPHAVLPPESDRGRPFQSRSVQPGGPGARSSERLYLSGFGRCSSHKHGYWGSLFQLSAEDQMSNSCRLQSPSCSPPVLPRDPASVCL